MTNQSTPTPGTPLLIEALTGIMGLIDFADGHGGLAGDNRTEYDEIWLPKAEQALALAGLPVDDGPGAEYTERFFAHIEALKAPPAFPFETRGFGRWPTVIEMIRLDRLVQRMLKEPDEDPDGEPIVCEYQVGWRVPGDEWEEYHQSWPSAVRCFHRYIDAHKSTNHEVWIHLDVFTVDKDNCKNNSIGNMEMLIFADGEYLVPWPW